MEKNTSENFLKLLRRGLIYDWQYNLVAILVIAGLVCTPMILGSIRAGAYKIHQQEAATTHNATEIVLTSRGNRVDFPVDESLRQRLADAFSSSTFVGGFELRLRASGPVDRYSDDARAIWKDDPRLKVFRITSDVDELDLRQVIVSDFGGRKLFGEAWDTHWKDRPESFLTVNLEINREDLGDFEIVGRTPYPNRDIYISPKLGAELRRYTEGDGSDVLDLQPTELSKLQLPKLRAGSCTAIVRMDTGCASDDFEEFVKTVGFSNHLVDKTLDDSVLNHQFNVGAFFQRNVQFRERQASLGDEGNLTEFECEEALRAKSVQASCQALVFNPNIAAEVAALSDSGQALSFTLNALSNGFERLLIEDDKLDLGGLAPEQLVGGHSIDEDGVARIHLSRAVSDALDVSVDSSLDLIVQGVIVPSQVAHVYDCGEGCREGYASPSTVFRLRNLNDKLIEVAATQPLKFRAAQTSTQYDKILIYAENIEAVPTTAAAIQDDVGDAGYLVEYNRRVIGNIKRDDARLGTLFQTTVVFSIIFLILALVSLSRINIERRSRQIAQLTVLGFSFSFVRLLVITEYLVVSAMALLTSLVIAAGLSLGLRNILIARSSGSDGSGADQAFQRVVNSMKVDPLIFLQLSALVLLCAFAVSAWVSYKLSRADPLELMD